METVWRTLGGILGVILFLAGCVVAYAGFDQTPRDILQLLGGILLAVVGFIIVAIAWGESILDAL